MDHGRVQELLHDYLDGELSATETRELEAHLAECDACRAELEDIRETLSMLSGLKRLEPSPDFLQQVNQKLRRRGKSAFDFSFGLDRKIPFEAVSMVMLGILLALYLLLVVLPKEKVDPDPPPQGKSDAGAAPASPALDDPSTRIRASDAGVKRTFAPAGGKPAVMAPPRPAPEKARPAPRVNPSGDVKPTRSKGR